MRDDDKREPLEHRDPQLESLLKSGFSEDVFESKRDILTLEEVMDALERVKGLPPLRAARKLMDSLVFRHVREFLRSDVERQVDEFGLDERFVSLIEPLGRWFHDHYFRVESAGLEHIPAEGRCLMVANHSGTLPYDGAMVVSTVRFQHPSARRVRPLVEDFMYHLPYLGMLMGRIGAVRASPDNARHLLEQEQATLVFPEGVKGIGKLYSKRYRLQRFGRGGAIKLAAQTRSPIVPVSIVGAEESMPLLSKVAWLARPLGLPYFPITPTLPWLGPLGLIPLPTKWYIDFGEPIHLEDPEKLLKDRVALNRANEMLRDAVEALMQTRLKSRPSIFGFKDLP